MKSIRISGAALIVVLAASFTNASPAAAACVSIHAAAEQVRGEYNGFNCGPTEVEVGGLRIRTVGAPKRVGELELRNTGIKVWVYCAKVAAGANRGWWKDPECSERGGTEEYIKYAIFPAGAFNPAAGTFTAKGGSSTLKAAGETVTCSSSVSSGEITNANEVGNMRLHFLGCKSSGSTESGCNANSVGAASGLIITTTVHGLLGLVLPSKSVGLLVLPTSGKSFVTLEGNACTLETKVTGNYIGLVSPVGVLQTTSKLTFSTNDAGATIDVEGQTVKSALTAFSASASEETVDSIEWSQQIEVT